MDGRACMDQVAADGRIGFERPKDADGALGENEAAENDAMRFGSLGALVPDAVYDRYWSWDSDEGSEGFDASDCESEECVASEEPLPTADEAFELFLGWVADRGIEPWPHQEEALMSLMVGDHVILGTPTGSGKSLVALGLHFMALCTGKVSYYTAPIKALVSEKFFYLVDVLGRENVGMITGDVSINPYAPVVCCTAEILANQALREGERADIGCVAMDEFHFYGDPQRGWAWQVPLLTLRARCRFLTNT